MENNPSRLSGVAKWLLIFGLILIANSAYIAAFGNPTFFYVANSLLHPVLGIIAAILLVVFARRRRDLFTGAKVEVALSASRPSVGDRRYRTAATVARLLLALATGFGIYLLFVGMTRPHSLALYIHVGASVSGLLLLLVILHARDR